LYKIAEQLGLNFLVTIIIKFVLKYPWHGLFVMKTELFLMAFTDFQLIHATDCSKTIFAFLNPIALYKIVFITLFKTFYVNLAHEFC